MVVEAFHFFFFFSFAFLFQVATADWRSPLNTGKSKVKARRMVIDFASMKIKFPFERCRFQIHEIITYDRTLSVNKAWFTNGKWMEADQVDGWLRWYTAYERSVCVTISLEKYNRQKRYRNGQRKYGRFYLIAH